MGRLRYEHIALVFSKFGERSVSAAGVANRLSKAMRIFSGHDVAVSHHLADQLLVPMALGAGGEFTTLRPSKHALTNAEVIEKFLACRIRFEPADAERVFVGSVDLTA